MIAPDRAQLFADLAQGRTSLRAIGGLNDVDVAALARVGAAALAGGRAPTAVTVFAALCALEPTAPLHALHLAVAERAAGNVAAACAAVDDAIARFGAADNDDVARALLLRAELKGANDPAEARADLGRALALTSTSARAVVAAAGVR